MFSPENNNDAEIAALKNQLFTLLVALIVVSGTFMVYLYRQVSIANKDIAIATAQSQQVNTLLAQNQNAIGQFIYRLEDYGQKHAEFAPLLKKYGLTAPPGAPGLSPAVAPKK